MGRHLKIAVGQYSDKGRKETNQDFHGVYVPKEPQLGAKGIAITVPDQTIGPAGGRRGVVGLGAQPFGERLDGGDHRLTLHPGQGSGQDQFQLAITVTGRDSGDAESPRLSRLQGFKVVSGPNISTQFQWVNGRSSSSKSFIYILIPEKEGQFTIDPFQRRQTA